MMSCLHLGVIDSDLCVWASSATPEMVETGLLVPGHPVVKAKPAPVSATLGAVVGSGWLDNFNCWVERHPLLAAGLLGGGYLLLRRAK